jgi:hypothetical protein
MERRREEILAKYLPDKLYKTKYADELKRNDT